IGGRNYQENAAGIFKPLLDGIQIRGSKMNVLIHVGAIITSNLGIGGTPRHGFGERRGGKLEARIPPPLFARERYKVNDSYAARFGSHAADQQAPDFRPGS